jgi:HD-GYP domain-containing protein (c-di-GMP phosphodiesterase class II)
VPLIRHHHEAYDGSGYPDGLKGDQIPLISRIVSVADTFDAMTTDRPYRKAKGKLEAVEELKRCAGTSFDPTVVEAFVESLGTRQPAVEVESQPAKIEESEIAT